MVDGYMAGYPTVLWRAIECCLGDVASKFRPYYDFTFDYSPVYACLS